VKARFDEEANLSCGERLEAAGVTVNYSFPGLKVHAKAALIRKVENGTEKLYTYMSTGNFNEDTAKIYSDFGFFTYDKQITSEIARLFSFLETVNIPTQNFEHLFIGQFNLKESLISMIENEIEIAKSGRKGYIFLKLNSLEDRVMIDLLYKASNAGVEVNLIVRGICCIVPGVPGFSENITAVSIVDRYLEHSRVFIFHNDGEETMLLSSADFMVRNLNYRIENAFPIYDQNIKAEIKALMNIQLADNVKARLIDSQGTNEYAKNISDLVIRSQNETYFYLKRKEENE
jgi:polyphosphate kinase